MVDEYLQQSNPSQQSWSTHKIYLKHEKKSTIFSVLQVSTFKKHFCATKKITLYVFCVQFFPSPYIEGSVPKSKGKATHLSSGISCTTSP